MGSQEKGKEYSSNEQRETGAVRAFTGTLQMEHAAASEPVKVVANLEAVSLEPPI